MTMQTTNTTVPLSTPEAVDLGLFLHRSTDRDGILRYELETQEGPMDAEGLAALRDLIALILDKPQRRQLTFAPDPSDTPVAVSCVNVAGVQVSKYQSTEDGVTVALETDEVVPAPQLVHLVDHLQGILREHAPRAQAEHYFSKPDAMDAKAQTVNSVIAFAVSNGYDVAKFTRLASERAGK